jgi:hypothetical protein
MTSERPSKAGERPVFLLMLQAERNVADPVHALRWVLKALLRHYGLRCVSVEERVQKP